MRTGFSIVSITGLNKNTVYSADIPSCVPQAREKGYKPETVFLKSDERVLHLSWIKRKELISRPSRGVMKNMMITLLLVISLFGMHKKSASSHDAAIMRHGFLHVDENSRYFAFEDSTPYIPIGVNKFALYLETDEAIDALLSTYAEHGINYMRIWVGLDAEPEMKVGHFDEESIRKLDYIIARSKKYGIYLTICFWNENGLGDERWNGHGQVYNKAVSASGTTYDSDDLKDVAHEPSWNAMKNRYAYFVNRWKDEPTVMMWDLVNDSKKTEAWKTQMYDFVRRHDNHHHMITLQYNTGKDPKGEMDCGSVRVYDYNPEGNDAEVMMTSLAERIRQVLTHGDPVYCGEGRMNYTDSSVTQYDLERGFLHFLWAPGAIGAAGNLHSWISIRGTKDTWPDLSEQELDWIKGYSDFCKNINWSQFNSRNVDEEISVDTSQVKAFACRDDKEMLMYLMNDDPDNKFTPIQTAIAVSSPLKGDRYAIDWIDIRTGKMIEREEIKEFPAKLAVPKFRDGIFAHIKRMD